MVKLFYGPSWFYGNDIIIDLFSAAILLLIAFYSIKVFTVKKNKRNIYLSISFLMLALSFFIKIAINYKIYYNLLQPAQQRFSTIAYQSLQSVEFLIVFILLYYLFALLGVYVLFSMYHKQPTLNHFLFIFIIGSSILECTPKSSQIVKL